VTGATRENAHRAVPACGVPPAAPPNSAPASTGAPAWPPAPAPGPAGRPGKGVPRRRPAPGTSAASYGPRWKGQSSQSPQASGGLPFRPCSIDSRARRSRRVPVMEAAWRPAGAMSMWRCGHGQRPLAFVAGQRGPDQIRLRESPPHVPGLTYTAPRRSPRRVSLPALARRRSRRLA